MAEYGANFDYGDSPLYKDDGEAPEFNVPINTDSTIDTSILVIP